MHVWGDDWFEEHGGKLYAAERYIWEYTYRWSKCGLISKEKYGSIRYEWLLPPGGRCYNVLSIKLPFVSWDYDHNSNYRYYWGGGGRFPVIIWRWADSWVYRVWKQYGKWVLDRAVRNACKKWPEIKDEILEDYDSEYIG